jgi:hypothetical protein
MSNSDEALRRDFRCRDHFLGIGDAVAGHGLFGDGQRPVGGGDQRGAVGGDETAHDGAAGFHHFGGDQNVDVAGGRHQREHRSPVSRRRHLDVVDRGAGALGHARHRRRLHRVAVAMGGVLDPVGQHAAALAADGHDRQLDDLVERGIEPWL